MGWRLVGLTKMGAVGMGAAVALGWRVARLRKAGSVGFAPVRADAVDCEADWLPQATESSSARAIRSHA